MGRQRPRRAHPSAVRVMTLIILVLRCTADLLQGPESRDLDARAVVGRPVWARCSVGVAPRTRARSIRYYGNSVCPLSIRVVEAKKKERRRKYKGFVVMEFFSGFVVIEVFFGFCGKGARAFRDVNERAIAGP